MPTCHILFANYLIIKQLMRVFEYIIISEWIQIKITGAYKSIIYYWIGLFEKNRHDFSRCAVFIGRCESAGPSRPSVANESLVWTLWWTHCGHYTLCTKPSKRRPSLWAHPGHRWVLQRTWSLVAAGHALVTRSFALCARLREPGLSCGGQPFGLRQKKWATSLWPTENCARWNLNFWFSFFGHWGLQNRWSWWSQWFLHRYEAHSFSKIQPLDRKPWQTRCTKLQWAAGPN